ncbi:MAG: hypothetical protein KJ685_05585 [Nanoarchaeota archaeon]|nr:hypothetical protein [Nanoarchaeota archaeon]MBU2441599.1 hypothetical protein [Nanoarchaeota archaeon]
MRWYAFALALINLIFLLVLVLFGRKVYVGFIGLLIFLGHFIGLLGLLFGPILFRLFRGKPKKHKKKKPEPKKKDFEKFRENDEIDNLIDSFEEDIGPKIDSKVETYDFQEPEPQSEHRTESPRQEPREMFPDESEFDDLTTSFVFDEPEEDEPIEELNEDIEEPIEEPEIRELHEAPKLDLEKVKNDLDRIDDGVKDISEKIKLISEKAILEGAQKKVDELEEKEKQKQKKSEQKVFASKTGTKYHKNKDCLSLKRVSKNNLISYSDSKEARKKKLTACDRCN